VLSGREGDGGGGGGGVKKAWVATCTGGYNDALQWVLQDKGWIVQEYVGLRRLILKASKCYITKFAQVCSAHYLDLSMLLIELLVCYPYH
jgi:hypothetical protein